MDGEAMRGDGNERDEGQARPFYGFGTVDADHPSDGGEESNPEGGSRFVDQPPRAAVSPYPPAQYPPPAYSPPPTYSSTYGANGAATYGGNGAPSPYPGNGAPPSYGQSPYGEPDQSTVDRRDAPAHQAYGQPPPYDQPWPYDQPASEAGYAAPATGYGQHVYGQPSFGRPPTESPPADRPGSSGFRPFGAPVDGDDRDTAMIPAVGGRHAAPTDRPAAPGEWRSPGRGGEVEGRDVRDRDLRDRERLQDDREGRGRPLGERDYDDEPVRSRRATGRRRYGPETDEAEEDARRVMPLWQELPLLLVVAFCLAVLIRTFLLQAFYIPSTSMEATLLVGDRVLVNKIVYDVRPPDRGEVVVFRGPPNWAAAPENALPPANNLFSRIGRTLGDLVGVSRPGEKDFIKRVIGLPGDRVSCCDPDGRLYVNGKGIDEPYINVNSSLDVPPSPGTCSSRRFAEVLVPPGQVFVMGDNRIVSQDSRCQGPVPIENIIGRAFVIVWPNSRWDTVGVPSTFDNVPGPVAIGSATPVPGGPTLALAALTLPILSALVVTASSTRKRRWVRRTLPR
jgi:signal peptidase I